MPTARAATYRATKAALHSYSLSLREKLKGQVEVIELAPPGVQTDLTPGQSTCDGYTSLAEFADEAVAAFAERPTLTDIAVAEPRCCGALNATAGSRRCRYAQSARFVMSFSI